MNSATGPSAVTEDWLALVIGNTRLHWGAFEGDRLISAWHAPHLERDLALRIQQSQFNEDGWQRVPGLVRSESASEPLPQRSVPLLPRSLWIASVVPEQTAIWANQRASDRNEGIPTFVVSRSQIPLQNVYPTLGIDRAINLLGAGDRYGWPALVIDAGTALTFTAGNDGTVLGGAILAGMRLQAQALARRTADLPLEDDWLSDRQRSLPNRWASTTSGAIASGLAYGTLSTIQDYLADWRQQFPAGRAILTGGDAPLLHTLLQQKTPEIASGVEVDSYLMFRGMQRYRSGAMLLL